MTLLHLKKFSFQNLQINHWLIEQGQHWCLLGTTASGKSRLAGFLVSCSETKSINDQPVLPHHCLCVGFESQQEQFEAELRDDDTDFMDRIDYGHTGMELLKESGADNAAVKKIAIKFGITPLLTKGFRMLSSGETRKLLIVRALLSHPDILILDEPFDSLDPASRLHLSTFLESVKDEQNMIICVNRLNDIQPWQSHVALMHKGKMLLQGEREKILRESVIRPLYHFDSKQEIYLPPAPAQPGKFTPLLSFDRSRVRYAEIIQFQNLSWVLNPGDHTTITGPNGAGKSTLLQLISGDHPQCYNNGVTVFGYLRGSGESIWDIKKHLGIISGSLHQDYRVPGSALSVVTSGLYDSIGIYCSVSEKEKHLALQWLGIVGLEEKAAISFRQLSWGEQRLVLIARSLIKHPPLLLLDEPTLGLDDQNRFMVLACLEKIAELGVSTMLFVSHREDEHLPLFHHWLVFEPDTEALYTVRHFHS